MAVGVTQRLRQLRKETVDLVERERTPVLHTVPQCTGVEVAHDEVGDAAALAVIEDRQDVRMFESGDDARLLLKALGELGALRQLPRQDLDRDVAVHGGLVRLIDGCHASLADLADDLVWSEHLSGLQFVHVSLSPQVRPGWMMGLF